LNKLEAQKETEKKKRNKDTVTRAAIQPAATAVVLSNNLSSLSLEELLVFEFSF
jgi:hypothetical protein